ncbi:type II secretion system F family protein [Nitrosococcus oceani]|uniref:Type II secretion system protein F n=2 Tax=Nitrosococcus oceani TaxID=1229 RepID=Q3JEA7_NITOC|nr:type II secretion system F family protein [Nitrosococcus oceani]KFI20792.1 type II secretion system protein F [Nitrosococcus oceani C-27]ABA56839.1 type II secretion system protein F [Nitrosococcus oceani ATCC 19707]EDZ65718.1 Bacterial type II secretion system protein F domain [Nitrosococcus oceani AFC27]KFI23863.1 type II secretion system protein F [Nitrosococcus oceani]GEM20596.1 type II secretion system protein F [Nitrosococcus oceani]
MAQAAAKQQIFIWEGANRQGHKIKGEVGGKNLSMVKADLRRQGIVPLKVRKKPKSLLGQRKKKITPKEIAIFSRQLATMMAAGVPLVQAFEIIGRGHESISMQEMVLKIKGEVEGGGTLAEALKQHPRQFDPLFCNLVHAGEQSGTLETLLDKIAMYKEKTEAIKGKIKKALFYPTAVVVVAFIITAILLIFVIPQFEALFQNFGADLPALTLLVLKLSALFQEWWWAIFGAMGGAIYGLMEAKRRSQKINHLFDRLLLKLPVIGEILNKATIARYARTLSTMFAAGVPLVEAMVSVAGAAGNSVYTQAILRIRDEVSTGTQLQAAMRSSQLFPNMVVQMVAIGEEAGSIDQMLSKVADFYEEEVDNAVDALSSLLEPLIMAILGVLVGGLVIAMYLPIFKMGSVV